MTNTSQKAIIQSIDPMWDEIRREAELVINAEPAVSRLMYSAILNHECFEKAIAARIADRLEIADLRSSDIRDAFQEAFAGQADLSALVRDDLKAVYERDPACDRFIEPILYFKGFQAIQAHRLAHWLLSKRRKDFALLIQSAVSERFQVDINPAVKIGSGFFMDHATSVVIGETAVIGNNVSILQNVTLGGTGKAGGDRHPKIGDGVLIGAGANVLGNLTIGNCARIAAGSVVLKDVPAEVTVAGVPAKVVGQAGCSEPSRSMHQILAEKGPDA